MSKYDIWVYIKLIIVSCLNYEISGRHKVLHCLTLGGDEYLMLIYYVVLCLHLSAVMAIQWWLTAHIYMFLVEQQITFYQMIFIGKKSFKPRRT